MSQSKNNEVSSKWSKSESLPDVNSRIGGSLMLNNEEFIILMDDLRIYKYNAKHDQWTLFLEIDNQTPRLCGSYPDASFTKSSMAIVKWLGKELLFLTNNMGMLVVAVDDQSSNRSYAGGFSRQIFNVDNTVVSYGPIGLYFDYYSFATWNGDTSWFNRRGISEFNCNCWNTECDWLTADRCINELEIIGKTIVKALFVPSKRIFLLIGFQADYDKFTLTPFTWTLDIQTQELKSMQKLTGTNVCEFVEDYKIDAVLCSNDEFVIVRVSPHEFCGEWKEPKLYVVDIRGNDEYNVWESSVGLPHSEGHLARTVGATDHSLLLSGWMRRLQTAHDDDNLCGTPAEVLGLIIRWCLDDTIHFIEDDLSTHWSVPLNSVLNNTHLNG